MFLLWHVYTHYLNKKNIIESIGIVSATPLNRDDYSWLSYEKRHCLCVQFHTRQGGPSFVLAACGLDPL